jgi:hypothetical protein
MNLLRLFVAVVLIPLAALLVAGGDAAPCDSDKVPTMAWDQACLDSCKMPALYNLCQETLQDAPDSAKVTFYAMFAAAAAKRSYEATIAEGQSPRAGVSDAVRRCVQGTTEAHARMEAVIRDMNACDFQNIWQEYSDAEALVQASGDALAGGAPLPADSPLVALNAADRDVTSVARALCALAMFLTGHV